jgi:replicative DNA helicase
MTVTETDRPDDLGTVARSLSSEKAVLGSMLLNNSTIRTAAMIVSADDFYDPRNQLLFGLIGELAETHDVVDPVLLLNAVISRGLLRRIGNAVYLAELVDFPITAMNVTHYAMRVRELSRVRRWRKMVERAAQAVGEVEQGYWDSQERGEPDLDLDRLNDRMAQFLLEGELLVDEKMSDAAIEGLSTWDEFLAVPDSDADWVVPGLFERQDVWMWLAGEGGGKSWLSRQLCQLIAAGVHPFDWDETITPQRTLLVDLENAESMIRRQSRGIRTNAARMSPVGVEQHSTNGWVWRRPQGLNIRKREDALLLESVIDRVRPQFVALGSLYNSFVKGRDDWETAAEDAKVVFNRLRTRYGFCLALEHHMPKGDGHDRPPTPYGSSVWQRWVTHGRVMNRVGENLWEFNASFRNDRDVRRTPVGLQRGGTFPWRPIWDEGDLDALIELEEEVHPNRNRRR